MELINPMVLPHMKKYFPFSGIVPFIQYHLDSSKGLELDFALNTWGTTWVVLYKRDNTSMQTGCTWMNKSDPGAWTMGDH